MPPTDDEIAYVCSALEAPFPDYYIKERPGAGRKTFQYVDGADVLRRILTATYGVFDWKIVATKVFPPEEVIRYDEQSKPFTVTKPGYLMVHGTLTIPGLGSRDGLGTAVCENEDSIKGAATDALKLAAKAFGVAMQLYGETHTTAPESHAQPSNTQKRPIPRTTPNGAQAEAQSESVKPAKQKTGIELAMQEFGRLAREIGVELKGVPQTEVYKWLKGILTSTCPAVPTAQTWRNAADPIRKWVAACDEAGFDHDMNQVLAAWESVTEGAFPAYTLPPIERVSVVTLDNWIHMTAFVRRHAELQPVTA